ncbi:MAG: MerR family transcriptional regulator, partial [Porphyromonadaceae bacterium]|nr:MerR family transcriptional regulator [Porphyromonadaceae bacterium]
DKGARRYTQQDIENIRTVQYLLRVRKFTIEGAQDELKRTK